MVSWCACMWAVMLQRSKIKDTHRNVIFHPLFPWFYSHNIVLYSLICNMMRNCLLSLMVPLAVCGAWSSSFDGGLGHRPPSSRRNFLTQTASVLSTAAIVSTTQPSYAEDDELIDVYFGCGCFWHVHQWVFHVCIVYVYLYDIGYVLYQN